MNEAVKNGHQTGKKREIKFSKLKLEDIRFAISQLGPYKKMTVEECQKLSIEKLNGRSVSDIVREERDSGW